MKKYSVVWLRRDLRLQDNTALFHGLKSGIPIRPLFIFDRTILDVLKDKSDPRVTFIHNTIMELDEELQSMGSRLTVYYDTPTSVFERLSDDECLDTVYVNRDYERYAIERDNAVEELLLAKNKRFKTYKDHVIFEKGEVTKKDGTPYTVFTPYKKKWLEKLQEVPLDRHTQSYYLKSYPCERFYHNFDKITDTAIPSLEVMGFRLSTISIPGKTVSRSRIVTYDETRDYPAIEGTSRLGIHFRFGTISIREKTRKAMLLNSTFVSELIWRDFYSTILQNFSYVETDSFRPAYDAIEWRYAEEDFTAWCEGSTGYPIVDAGMRELNATGHMHNRVRMITASFLTKHLLIDWRKGERYFAEKLLDYDLASNSGGWQWAAGCGTDAAPYFRIFNPYTQAEKFDKERKYIKHWVPEVDTDAYPEPIVDHKFARERCLSVYKLGLGKT